jgi:hypothetical protein
VNEARVGPKKDTTYDVELMYEKYDALNMVNFTHCGRIAKRSHIPLNILGRQRRSQGENCGLEHALATQHCKKGSCNDGPSWQKVLVVPWSNQHRDTYQACINIVFLPTAIAQMLMPTRGTRFHQSTTLIPHLSAMKLNGIVTRKSVTKQSIISPADCTASSHRTYRTQRALFP